MDDQPETQSHQVSTWVFLLALAIVLVAVTAGYFLLVQPQERQRPANKPTALGHYPPVPPQTGTNSAARGSSTP